MGTGARLVISILAVAMAAGLCAKAIADDAAEGKMPENRIGGVIWVDASAINKEVQELRRAVDTLQDRLTAIEKAVKEQGEAVTKAVAALHPPTQWDYIFLRSKSQEEMNKLGKEGWELTTSLGEWLVFKRPAR